VNKFRNILLIYNPAAKPAVDPDNWLGVVINRLCEESDSVVTIRATRPGMTDADILQGVDPAVDLLIAAGGDGTIRHVLSAMARAKNPIPIGIIPAGTGNQFARNLNIYEDNLLADPLEHALQIILHGQLKKVDLGMMNGQYFSVGVGAGPMSDAVILPGRENKTNWKMLAYASSMIQTFAMPPVVFNVTADGVKFCVSASGIFVTNITNFGMGTIGSDGDIDDGYLDLCILNPTNFSDYIDLGFAFAGGFVGGEAPYYKRKVKTVDIEVVPVLSPMSSIQRLGHSIRNWFKGGSSTSAPRVLKQVAAMIDGDACGTTPMHIETIPQAVGILVPPTAIPESIP